MHHLRARNGDHEVDFIIERDDHKIVVLESSSAPPSITPTSSTCTAYATTSDPNILDTAVITTGAYAYRRGNVLVKSPSDTDTGRVSTSTGMVAGYPVR